MLGQRAAFELMSFAPRCMSSKALGRRRLLHSISHRRLKVTICGLRCSALEWNGFALIDMS